VTPWTIRDDQKILLPQLSGSDDAQKVALAASIDFGGAYRMRVVNVHLQSGLTPVQVGDQAQVITQCVFEERCPVGTRPVGIDSWADRSGSHGKPGNVVLAGDFNTSGEAHIQVLTSLLTPQADRVPFDTPTFWLLGAVTLSGGRLDHVFHGEGLAAGEPQVGTITVSDHRPVMVEFSVVPKRP
jgi:endonuclease/exonuclease/phosphatase family metal-dependent hydrolase